MLIPNKHENTSSYRYGFQGQEKNNELKGEGNSLNYKYRMHDPRIGMFFAVDPLAPKYPWYTPYQFSGNRVIDVVELGGLEEALPDIIGTKLTRPDGRTEYHVEGLIPFLNSNDQTVAYIVPEGVGAGLYTWINEGKWRAYFDSNKRNYSYYYSDAEYKRDHPIAWAINSAFTDTGQPRQIPINRVPNEIKKS